MNESAVVALIIFLIAAFAAEDNKGRTIATVTFDAISPSCPGQTP
jgi:hypothetical protein